MANHVAIYEESERQFRHFLAPLVKYIDSPTVNEIMINRSDSIFVEDAGQVKQIDIEINSAITLAAINAIMSMNRKDVSPLMDARLKGMRVAAVLPPFAVHGPVLSIRKLPTVPQTLDAYVGRGDFSQTSEKQINTNVSGDERAHYELKAASGGTGLMEFFQWAMATRQDVALVGGTSSGKTTLAGALLACIPKTHRIITGEDTNEIVLTQPNVVQLEANAQSNVSLRQLIRMMLRLRPDRIIIGEVRGGELFDLLRVMNSGHPGGLFTLHADSAEAGLQTMETYLRESEDFRGASQQERRETIISALDYVVYQGRRGASRGPEEVLGIGKQLDRDNNYVLRHVFSRQI